MAEMQYLKRQITAQNFPQMMKDVNCPIQQVQFIQCRIKKIYLVLGRNEDKEMLNEERLPTEEGQSCWELTFKNQQQKQEVIKIISSKC